MHRIKSNRSSCLILLILSKQLSAHQRASRAHKRSNKTSSYAKAQRYFKQNSNRYAGRIIRLVTTGGAC